MCLCVCDASSLRLPWRLSSHTGTPARFSAVKADTRPIYSCPLLSVSRKRVTNTFFLFFVLDSFISTLSPHWTISTCMLSVPPLSIET